jgi:hypothetical protein
VVGSLHGSSQQFSNIGITTGNVRDKDGNIIKDKKGNAKQETQVTYAAMGKQLDTQGQKWYNAVRTDPYAGTRMNDKEAADLCQKPC